VADSLEVQVNLLRLNVTHKGRAYNMNDFEYEYLKRKINELTQIDLNRHRGNLIIHRLDSFISRDGTDDILQYCDRLDNDPAELTNLRSFITINVSEYYRDLMHFDTLRKNVLPPSALTVRP